jgi:sterol desaturase/sphingolipid hydroxylase (fatty acid hydroxylase superfamily)
VSDFAVTRAQNQTIGLLAAALFAAGVLLWLAVLSALALLEFSSGARAASVLWLEARSAALPFPLHLSGDRTIGHIIEKLSMLSLAIVPVLLLETAVCGWRSSSLSRIWHGRSTSSLYDLAIYGLNLVGLWKYITIMLTFGGIYLANGLVAGLAGGLAHFDMRLRTGSLVLDSCLAFVAFTFCDYWNHRLQHSQPLWPLHRVHHTATEMTVLTLWRAHPAIPAIEPFFKLWPLALFDVPASVVAIVGMVTVTYEHLIHSNVRWNWGWFGRWVLIPPMGHRLHHHVDLGCQNKNFGIPVWWDRLFGTWDGGSPPSEQLGITDLPTNTGRLHAELWFDLVDFTRQVRRILASLLPVRGRS